MIDLANNLPKIDIDDVPQINVSEISKVPMTRFPGTEPNFWLRHYIMMNAMLHKQEMEDTTYLITEITEENSYGSRKSV